MELEEKGILQRYNVEMIGASAQVIRRAEDRQLFKEAMQKIGLEMPRSGSAHTASEAFAIAKTIGSWPLVILPGAKVRSMVPGRVQKAPSFDFTKPEWQKGQWQHLNHIQLGKLHEQTRFKMLYDNKNVYFGIISDLPAKRKFKNMGHDGDLWWYDGMEILLDPVGAREVSYHFICNPLPNSWYEGALGLIKDPLHPRFGREDKSWNGKWSYETRRKGDVWEVLITIPYTTLNTTPPVKGTVWTMNVARQSYPEALGRAGEVGLWSPNLENLSISDNLNAFGEVRFQ